MTWTQVEILAGLPEGFLSEHPERITLSKLGVLELCESAKVSYELGFGQNLPLDWALAKMLDPDLAMTMLEAQLIEPVWKWVNEGETEAIRWCNNP